MGLERVFKKFGKDILWVEEYLLSALRDMDKMVASIKDEELKLEVEKIIFRIDTAKINVGNLFMTHRNISAEVQKDLEQLKIWVNQLSESTFHLSMLVRKEIHPNNIDLKITKIHKNVEGVEGEMWDFLSDEEVDLLEEKDLPDEE